MPASQANSEKLNRKGEATGLLRGKNDGTIYQELTQVQHA